MKNLILTILCLCLTNFFAYSQFKNIGGDGKAIVIDVFANVDTIYALSNSIIHKSADGGQTWVAIPGSQLLGDLEEFHVNGDFIVAVDVKVEFDWLDMTIYSSKDGGLNWVKKDIYRPDYFFSLYEDDISITIHDDIITVATNDEIFVSKDFGVNFAIISDKKFNHERSDFIYFQDGHHYIIEHTKVTKTTDFITFTTVDNSESSGISGFFRDHNSIYIYSDGTQKLVGDAFDAVALDPLLFDRDLKYNFDENYLYVYNKYQYEIQLFDDEFNPIKVIDISTIIDVQSDYERFLVYGGFIYYYNTLEYGLYKKDIITGSNSVVEITDNIKGALGNYIIVDNSLWQITTWLSYYNRSADKWQSPNINFENNEYAIVNKNSIITTNTRSIVNLGGVKIRATDFPFLGPKLFNCNDIVMARDDINKTVYTLIDGILPWIEIEYEISWEKIKTDFSNGNYIIHNEIDEILYTSNKYTWQKIKLNPSVIGNQKISSVQINVAGEVFITASKSLYKYNALNNTWLKVNSNLHPYPNQTISDFAIYKDVMVQTIYGHGVVISLDQGLTWQTFEDGLPDPYMVDIMFSDSHLFVTNLFEVFERPLSEIPGLSSTDQNITSSDTSISIYPNPVTDVLNYELINIDSPTNIEIYNTDGTTVYEQKNNTQIKGQIDVVTFKSGIYFIKTNTADGPQFKKLIKL